jgi:hypothetical protein
MSWSLHLSAYLDENPDFVEAGWKAEPVFRWLLALDVRRGFEGRIPAAYSAPAFIAAQRRMPLDDVTEALGGMEGKLVHRYPDGSLEILPHPDWEQPRTPKQRQAAKRYRDKSAAAEAKRAQLSLAVTASHEASRGVTGSDAVDRDVTPPDPLPDPLPIPEKPFARGRARDLVQDEKACGSSSPAGTEPREPEGLRREKGSQDRETDPRVRVFIAAFMAAYRERVGVDYPGKDHAAAGKKVRELDASFTGDALTALAREYVTGADDFQLNRRGLSLHGFFGSLSALMARRQGVRARASPPGVRGGASLGFAPTDTFPDASEEDRRG